MKHCIYRLEAETLGNNICKYYPTSLTAIGAINYLYDKIEAEYNQGQVVCVLHAKIIKMESITSHRTQDPYYHAFEDAACIYTLTAQVKQQNC